MKTIIKQKQLKNKRGRISIRSIILRHKKKVLKILSKKRENTREVKNLSFERLISTIMKINEGSVLKYVDKSSENKLKTLNPYLNLMELRQFFFLTNQLKRAPLTKLFLCVENKPMEILLEELLLKFPYVRRMVVLSRAARMREALKKINTRSSFSGIVIFLGKISDNMYDFFVKRNFMFINSITLKDTSRFDRYILSLDSKNIKVLIWFFIFIKALYKKIRRKNKELSDYDNLLLEQLKIVRRKRFSNFRGRRFDKYNSQNFFNNKKKNKRFSSKWKKNGKKWNKNHQPRNINYNQNRKNEKKS